MKTFKKFFAFTSFFKKGRNMKARPSSSDRVLKCAGSLDKGDYPVDEKSDAARDGHAKHALAARFVAGTLSVNDLQRFADYYDVDAGELEVAGLYVKAAWGELKEHFPVPLIEMTGEGVACIGTSDVKSLIGAAILDWKFGWSHEEHPMQLLGYADIILQELDNKMPECGYILAFEVFVRFREYRAYKFNLEQIEGYRARMLEQISLKGKQYNAGAHCKFCPRINSCGARLDYMHAVSNELAPYSDSKILVPADLGKLYDRVQMLKKATKRYDDHLTNSLDKGPIDLGEGRVIELQPQTTTSIAVNKESWNLLTNQYGFKMNDMSKCLKMTKTAMEKILTLKADKGKGASVKRDVMNSLKELGAIKEGVKYTKRVKVVA